MKNERDKEELSRYFGHHQPSQKTPRTSRSQQQWFDDGMDDDDEDMKVAPDSFSKSNFNRNSSGKNSFNQDSQFGDFEEPPKKRKRASKLSRFAESFVLICVFVGIAIFLAYFALVSASDPAGLGSGRPSDRGDPDRRGSGICEQNCKGSGRKRRYLPAFCV